MKIGNITSKFINRISPKPKVSLNEKIFSQGLNSDVFEKSEKKDLLEEIQEKRNFKISDYKLLTNKEKAKLRKIGVVKDIQDHISVALSCGLSLKNYFDDVYGKDNYVFVSIGTSPSTIGRVMEFCGVETKYLPISGMGVVSDDFKFKYSKEYAEFLKEQKLTPEDIANSGKTYLFTDHIASGRTLRAFKRMMSEVYGVHPDTNVKYFSLVDKIRRINKDNELADDMELSLISSHPQVFGGIPHLNFMELNLVNDTVMQRANLPSKIFNFELIEKLKRRKLLKYNPANENAL